jgi:hypothetical protein
VHITLLPEGLVTEHTVTPIPFVEQQLPYNPKFVREAEGPHQVQGGGSLPGGGGMGMRMSIGPGAGGAGSVYGPGPSAAAASVLIPPSPGGQAGEQSHPAS